jgi:hypothetical protein
MGKVISSPSMSLDSFIESPDYTVLSDWYESGDVEVPAALEELPFALTPQSAEYWRGWTAALGRFGSRNTVTEVR